MSSAKEDIVISYTLTQIEFKGPVLGTAKRPETGLDRTGKDRTAVASCII